MKKTIKVLLALPVIYLSGCAVDKNYQDFLHLQNVEERVSHRWEALLKRDHQKAYGFLTASYRDMATQDDYIKTLNPKIVWDSFDIIRTRCEEQLCKVNVEAKYHIPPMFGMPQGMSATEIIKEQWMFDESDWYYLPPIDK
ncbi:MAG: hypothetical protein P1P78_15395 [Methyloprofundus sp.]|nr:hypothetical protein [Methyloprofundus sp.]